MLRGSGNQQLDTTTPPREFQRTVAYRFRLQNRTSQPVFNARFHVYAPVKQTCAQQCLKIKASHPYKLEGDATENQLMVFSFKQFPPFASKNISIHAEMVFSTAPGRVDRHSQPIPVPPIETESIQHLARTLITDAPHQTAGNIYHWIKDHIRYSGYAREARGALYALARREGDCTEFADLFVALVHASGIPARRVSGYLAPEGGVLKPSAYHDWAEFYDNGIWRIADAQQKNFDNHYPDYIAMRVGAPETATGGERRFHQFFVEGNGLTATME